MQAALPDTLCYLNGEYTRVCDAKVSVLDRGFIFGDGVYEVAPVYGGRLFRFDEHMARLQRNLGKVRITNPHSREEWLERCRKLVAALAEQKGAQDQLVYIQVTRGVAVRDHVMPADITPTVFMMVTVMKPPGADMRHHGVACVTARDFRWERGDIKSISLLGNVLARQMAFSPRRRPATCGSPTKAPCSARRRASTCSKAFVMSCCASCAKNAASPTTCAPFPRPTCVPPMK